MRALNIVLGLLMVAFSAVQYNDPDALLWVAYYGVPAVCSIAVAFRPQDFRGAAMHLLVACLAGVVLLTVYYWPQVPDFWRKDVWINEESAREGMGLMIASLAVAVAVFTATRQRRSS